MNNKLFILDSKDTEILIRLTSKCSSNCYNCELPYKKTNNIFSLENFSSILNYIHSNVSGERIVVGLLGYGLFNLLDSILDYFSNYKSFTFSIQIDLDDLMFNYNKILNYSKKSNNLIFSIQLILRKQEDLKKFLSAIKIIEKNNLNVRINIILDFVKYSNLIKIFLKKYSLSDTSKNNISIFIGDSYIEFERDMFYDNIKDFSYNSCLGLENFRIIGKEIHIKDDIEFSLDGSIKFHLNNFCNKGIKKISTIFNKKSEVLDHFNILQNKLSKYNLLSNKCSICNKNPLVINE